MLINLKRDGRFLKPGELTPGQAGSSVRFLCWKFNSDIIEFLPQETDSMGRVLWKLEQLYNIILESKEEGNHLDFVTSGLVMIGKLPNAKLATTALYLFDSIAYKDMDRIVTECDTPREFYNSLLETYAMWNRKGLTKFSRGVQEGKYDWKVLFNG